MSSEKNIVNTIALFHFSQQKQTPLDCEHFSVSNIFPDCFSFGYSSSWGQTVMPEGRKKKSNGAGRKVMPIYCGKLGPPLHLKIHEKICTFKKFSFLLVIHHDKSPILVAEESWPWLFSYFAS